MADLLYKAERKGRSLLVAIEERGSKRILYLDTLKALAKESDKEALALLAKLQLRPHGDHPLLFAHIDLALANAISLRIFHVPSHG